MNAQISKAAKTLIRIALKRNLGVWAYYEKPSTCLYGPHAGVSFWSHKRDYIKAAMDLHGLEYRCYDEHGISGQVLDYAKRIGSRHGRFVESACQWREVERIAYADNSVESYQVDRHGNRRTVTLTHPSGDACF